MLCIQNSHLKRTTPTPEKLLRASLLETLPSEDGKPVSRRRSLGNYVMRARYREGRRAPEHDFSSLAFTSTSQRLSTGV